MEVNEWINGHLEAILDSSSLNNKDNKKKNFGNRVRFNPTKYFVEEVVTGAEETDLHRTWIKVVATRNTRQRTCRLQNMCWRIWHLIRKKKQLECEKSPERIAKRRFEREQGRSDVREEMSETVKGDILGDLGEGANKKHQHDASSLEGWSDYKKEKKLYIILISLHGLIRGYNMELGRDSDTGGQTKYVVELARALAKMPEVYRVDLFTRQVSSPDVDWSYCEPTEMLTATSDDLDENAGESSGAYIVRIPFGPHDKYLRKELLWPYVQEFVDGALAHILNMTTVLGEQIGGGHPIWPYVIHGHYADAGDSAAILSGALNVPMILTGHSLGRNKLDQLLKQGRQSKEDINSTYRIMRRIEGEELSLDATELVITSTKQEIDEQWGLYDGFDVKLERVLRTRARRGVDCHGHFMPRMAVIPPGMDFSNVIQEANEADGDLSLANTEGPSSKSVPTIWSEVMRFLANPHKPMILALSRPDPKKNITTLLKAYGKCNSLRELANLTLIMGNRDDIDEMSAENASVLTIVLKLVDKYDLYGQVAFPKHHKQNDVPEIYRLAAKTKGVFINPALVEPFGLTLIEAAAHGLPMVATKNGGPVDIHKALNNGLLIDPHDQQGIANALLKLLSEKNLWHECQRNGWSNIHRYSWPEHCSTYLTRMASYRMRHPAWKTDTAAEEMQKEESLNDSLQDVQDASLLFSIDGGGGGDIQDQVKRVMSKMKKPASSVKDCDMNNNNDSSKYPILRKRQKLVVIAVDCYDSKGEPEKTMISVIQETFKAINLDSQWAEGTGVAISTAMPLSELRGFLKSWKIKVNEFDAVICSSGSEVYYPGTCEEDGELYPDPDYALHVEYRWGFDGVKKTILKMMNAPEDTDTEGKSSKASKVIEEDVKASNPHCLSYIIRNINKANKVDDMRQKFRIRGLRCHLLYCRNSTRMQVVPLLASRAQALRFFFVRWRLNVANMYVVLGETGDTDYEELIPGTHKTVIIKGVVKRGCEELLRTSGSYLKEDVVPGESPLFAYVNGTKSEDIASALIKVSKCSA